MEMNCKFMWLALISGYIVAIIVGVYGLLIAYKILMGDINLAKMLCEKNGEASLSRFQFLIFTFVIAMSLLLLVIANISVGEINFPDVPTGIWALLGISGGSYVVSKGIQKKTESDVEKKKGSGNQGLPAGK